MTSTSPTPTIDPQQPSNTTLSAQGVRVFVIEYRGRLVCSLLGRKDVAKLLVVDPSTVDRMVKDGQLGCVRVRSRVLFSLADVQELVGRCRE